MQHPVIDAIVQKAKAELSVRRIWLFGSRSRGDAHPKSDIDLAFELSDAATEAWARFATDVHEHARTLLPIDLVNIDTCDGALRQVILKEGVLFYGSYRERKAWQNAEAAVLRLEQFLRLPVQNDRDQAGVIQAFEFTFETCWKLLQKIAQAQGLAAASPKMAIGAGFRLGLCEPEEAWLVMLEDRNLTSHTYRAELAEAIFKRIAASHAGALRSAIDACRALLAAPLA